MTVPMQYAHAVEAFDAFLKDAANEADLVTRHQSYTMVEGVLRAFRRRLSLIEAIAFAQVLPPLVRALFIDNWDIEESRVPFGSREDMTRDVKALRPNHNLSPDTAIANVATALRRHVDETAFDAALAGFPADAQAFWSRSPG